MAFTEGVQQEDVTFGDLTIQVEASTETSLQIKITTGPGLTLMGDGHIFNEHPKT